MKKIALTLIKIASGLPYAETVARKVVDFARNQNNCAPDSNGEMTFMTRNAQGFQTIFDVGANVGDWTAEVSKLCPQAQIYSFEPVSKTFDALSGYTSEKVHPHKIALGDSNESREIFVSDSDSTLNSVYSRASFGVTKPEQLEIRTLDSFCKEHKIERISFLKIDTEGNELNVLKGASEYVRQGRIDVMQIEYGGTYINARIMLKDIFDFFENTEYELDKMYPHHALHVPAYSQDLENCQYANYLAIRKSYDHR